jgi:hypothetical protein
VHLDRTDADIEVIGDQLVSWSLALLDGDRDTFARMRLMPIGS